MLSGPIMNTKLIFSLLVTLLVCQNAKASDEDSISLQTQLSLFGLYNPSNSIPGFAGVRLVPQLDYLRDFEADRRLSAEISANVNLNADVSSSALNVAASARLYRAWLRYSTQRNEVRAGLQQLNFGSATLLRPLQWFDGLNPTDPLRMTNGVWGVLDRIYFKNNATLWLWGLYGNKDARVWDPASPSANLPEVGFRFQQPVTKGEMAISANYRTVDGAVLGKYRETKLGLDGKWDVGPGLWFEDSFKFTSADSPLKSGQNMLTVGADLTPDFLDGVSFMAEHMLINTYATATSLTNTMNLSALSASWPITIFNRLSGIALYSWEANYWFRYLTWSADFDRSSFYVIGFWNPNLTASVLSLGSGSFSRYGFQLMYVLHL